MFPAQELDIEQKKILIVFVEKHTEKPFGRIFGEPRINLLRLSVALDFEFMGANL